MRSLITGVTGQDGSYLAEHLLKQGHEVWGLLRGQDNPRREWLEATAPGINLVLGDLLDQQSLNAALAQVKPDEVYNLGAISSPGLAWQQPVLTTEVTGLGALRLFEAVRTQCPEARVVQASTIAHHGPYGAAKLFAQTVADDYRNRGLHVSCAVFGGHHSPRRGESFFSRKVTKAVAGIVKGTQGSLQLGSLHRKQDWGWATDFVTVLPRLATLPPDNYVMSTGEPHSVEEWVEFAFECVGLYWRDYVWENPDIGNVTDVEVLSATPDPRLNWEPRQEFESLVNTMVEADLG